MPVASAEVGYVPLEVEHQPEISERSGSYNLQYSTVVGTWSSSYLYYNCYMYAVGRTYNGAHPGYFSDPDYGPDSFEINQDLSDIADIVKDDLLDDQFNYPCVYTTTTRPTGLPSGKLAIALRLGLHKYNFTQMDYHFMRTTTGTDWYHKPAQSMPLKVKDDLEIDEFVWTSEGVVNGVVVDPVLYDYMGDIYYIIASEYHGTLSYTYTGNNYHSGGRHYFEYRAICSACGISTTSTWRSQACSGPPCVNLSGNIEDEPVTE